MEKQSILRQLRDVCHSFVDEYGNFRVQAIGVVDKLNINDERQELLKDIVYLLRNTDIVNIETKMYLFNRTTNREINEKLIEDTGVEIPFNTTQAKIQYGKTKLESLLGDSVKRLLYQTFDIRDIPKLVFDLNNKYNTNKLRDNILLELNKNVYADELTDEDFDDFLMTISPYIKTQVEFITNNIDEKKIGYFNYIVTSNRLKDIDKKRLDILRKLLGYDN